MDLNHNLPITYIPNTPKDFQYRLKVICVAAVQVVRDKFILSCAIVTD